MSNHGVRSRTILKPKHVTPSRDDFEVVAAFNAAICRFEGEYLFLVRVAEKSKKENENWYFPPKFEFDKHGKLKLEGDKPSIVLDKYRKYRHCRPIDATGVYSFREDMDRGTTISHIRLARITHDGKIDISHDPAFLPYSIYEEWGIEDPRIVFLDGRYIVSTVGYSSTGIRTLFRKTDDFQNFSEPWVVVEPDCKDTFPYPKKCNGRYCMQTRPLSKSAGPIVQIAFSKDPELKEWGNFEFLMGRRKGKFDSHGIGGATPPLETEQGLLEIYHGAGGKNKGIKTYSTGAVLLDPDDPTRIIARSKIPFLKPDDYTHGLTPGVKFVSGAILEDGGDNPKNKILKLSGGSNDTNTFLAEIPLSYVFDSLKYYKKEEYQAAIPTTV